MQQAIEIAVPRPWYQEKLLMGLSLPEYVRSLVTPFNAVAGCILLVGLPLIAYRFYYGLGAIRGFSQTNPWSIFIGFNMLVCVAIAAGGYLLATTVYLFRLKEYYVVLRPAVLTGFLGYLFAVVGLLVDLGRPWRIPYPVFYSYGVISVMFLVAWHVFLYLTVQFLEFSPAIFEWLGWKNVRTWALKLTIFTAVSGVILSTLHQSALGALFLLAPTKLHPLWYSPYIPVFFYVSSITAGLSMLIVVCTLCRRIFRDQIDPERHVDLDRVTLGLGKAISVVLFTYFFLKLLGLGDNGRWDLLLTPMGYWFLFSELLGFVLLPCFLFAHAVRQRNVKLVQATAVLALIGVVVNRVNVCLVAFNWNSPGGHLPTWMELVISLTIITLGVLTFRWIVNRMPVLYEHPEYGNTH